MLQPNLAGLLLLAALTVPAAGQAAGGVEGYYRYPALAGDTLFFAAEGDLWTVPAAGGLARRLTTHPGEEAHPAVSPDGSTLAFSAAYEGSTEVYTMPVAGGLPARRTWEAEPSTVNGWTPGGELIYATMHYSTLPDLQLVALDLAGGYRRLPLSQASEGSVSADGKTLFFVRPADHRNVTKRYRGGTARKIWRFVEGAAEAEVLTAAYDGESHTPMAWRGRVYFISDRDGTMNLWSMNEAGGDLRQHTRHSGWDVRDASLSEGRVVYQVGADLWLYDIAADEGSRIPIRLATDVDQWREKWVTDPMEYLTSARPHPEGESVVLTTRGRVFVMPARQGRRVRAVREPGVRYRDAVFLPDGDNLLALSDQSGELEFVEIPADGVGGPRALTEDGTILRFGGYPSPDGRWVAYTDQNRDLWLLEIATGEQRVISTNREGVAYPAWSPDSRWLAFTQQAFNSFGQLWLYGVEDGSLTAVTSDRVNSWSAAWDPGGEWLYFLSDRDLASLVGSPWGTRQPEPFFDKPDKIYQVALRRGLRSPFQPDDELAPDEEEEETGGKGGKGDKGSKQDAEKRSVEPIRIDLEGLAARVRAVPAPAANYRALSVNDSALFWLERESGRDGKSKVAALEVGNEPPEPKTILADAEGYELSLDGKKLLLRTAKALYMVDAEAKTPADLDKKKIDLAGWSFPINVREDWRQIFVDAWRLERDYFYDPGMHGVDWEAVRDKYLPLVDRVTTRDELSELIGRAVGELSALHTSVRGGDHREGPDQVEIASLGARLVRDPEAGGYRIEEIYRADPDYPEEIAPLADPSLEIEDGDLIVAVNGVEALSVPHLGALLRNQEGRQVRLRVRPLGGGEERDRIVTPIEDEWSLRYRHWRYSRRREVEQRGEGKIGYVHLSAMGGRNLTEWYRQFYPVFDRPGLIIDVRHNRGGNIDSIILEKLLRRAWFYWKGRVEKPYWNMQYAFRGHLVVLVDQRTASDGEAFAEGIQRLGLGPVIGTRTWGGEIWLSSTNRLSDHGLARAPMWGVYGPEGKWLIEGWGVEPDVEVDNPPRETFDGRDRQLETAVELLLEKIETDPREVPPPPPYPDLSFDYGPEE